MELKRPTTFDEQIILLKQKGIVITNSNSCKNFLSKTNYYRLSGYYLPFIFKQNEQCIIPIPFERIQLSYYHAHTYGSEGYMNSSSFNDKHNHSTYLKHIKACISENSNTFVVKHHIQNYYGHFPIWVIIDFFSIGMLSYFYRGMKNKDKSKIAKELYGNKFFKISRILCIFSAHTLEFESYG